MNKFSVSAALAKMFGINPWGQSRVTLVRGSKYQPHQGQRERNRRMRQIIVGQLPMSILDGDDHLLVYQQIVKNFTLGGRKAA